MANQIPTLIPRCSPPEITPEVKEWMTGYKLADQDYIAGRWSQLQAKATNLFATQVHAPTMLLARLHGKLVRIPGSQTYLFHALEAWRLCRDHLEKYPDLPFQWDSYVAANEQVRWAQEKAGLPQFPTCVLPSSPPDMDGKSVNTGALVNGTAANVPTIVVSPPGDSLGKT